MARIAELAGIVPGDTGKAYALIRRLKGHGLIPSEVKGIYRLGVGVQPADEWVTFRGWLAVHPGQGQVIGDSARWLRRVSGAQRSLWPQVAVCRSHRPKGLVAIYEVHLARRLGPSVVIRRLPVALDR